MSRVSPAEVRRLLEAATGVTPDRADAALVGAGARRDWAETLAALLDRLRAGEPAGYIAGIVDFFGRALVSDKRALLIRPYTEVFVRRILDDWHDREPRVVEVGCGAGAMIVTLALELASSAGSFTGTDIDPAALEVARENAARHGAPVELTVADVLDGVGGPFDVILANLPTHDASDAAPEAATEPEVALYDLGGAPLGIVRKCLHQSLAEMTDSGRLYIEIPEDTARADLFAGEPIALAHGEVVGRAMTREDVRATAEALERALSPARGTRTRPAPPSRPA